MGPSKEMPMVDEHCIQSAIRALIKEGLPMVCVIGTNVHQPRQPEVPNVVNTTDRASGQYFKETLTLGTEKSGAEAPTGVRDNPTRGHRDPARRIAFQEGICHQQRFPFRNSQAARTIEFSPDALVKGNVGPLRIVSKLDDIKMSIACLSENRLCASTELADISNDTKSASGSQGR